MRVKYKIKWTWKFASWNYCQYSQKFGLLKEIRSNEFFPIRCHSILSVTAILWIKFKHKTASLKYINRKYIKEINTCVCKTQCTTNIDWYKNKYLTFKMWCWFNEIPLSRHSTVCLCKSRWKYSVLFEWHETKSTEKKVISKI